MITKAQKHPDSRWTWISGRRPICKDLDCLTFDAFVRRNFLIRRCCLWRFAIQRYNGVLVYPIFMSLIKLVFDQYFAVSFDRVSGLIDAKPDLVCFKAHALPFCIVRYQFFLHVICAHLLKLAVIHHKVQGSTSPAFAIASAPLARF